jgi:hypothetical protein
MMPDPCQPHARPLNRLPEWQRRRHPSKGRITAMRCHAGQTCWGAAEPRSHQRAQATSPSALSARVILRSRTMVAGSSLKGHVMVENNTGHVIHTFGCLTLFQVLLVSSRYHPQVAWPLWAQSFTIPVGGRVTAPLSWRATTGAPRTGRALPQWHACLAEVRPRYRPADTTPYCSRLGTSSPHRRA